MINLNRIKCELNRAISDEEVARMAVSIGNVGLLQPLILATLTGDEEFDYQVIGGRCRYLALRQLERWEIAEDDVRIIDSGDHELISYVENSQRVALAIGDEIRQLADLSGRYEVSELATMLGRTEKYIRCRIRLGNLAPKYRQALETNLYPAMSIRHYEILAGYPPEAQLMMGDNDFCWSGTVKSFAVRLSSRLAHLLAAAPFQTAACAGCQNRSGAAPWLFEEYRNPADDHCLDPQCWEQKQVAALVDAAKRALANGLLLLDLSYCDKLPAPLAKLAHFDRDKIRETSAIGCPEDKAQALIIGGCDAGKYCKVKLLGGRESAGEAAPLTLAERREKLTRRREKAAALKFADYLVDPERTFPRPDQETLVKLAISIGVHSYVDGSRPRLDKLDGMTIDKIQDELWKQYVFGFAERAKWVKQCTLDNVDIGEVRAAAELCQVDFAEFEQAAATEIPEPACWSDEDENQ